MTINEISASGSKMATLMRAAVATVMITFGIVIAHNLVHEGGHALAAKALGYQVVARINHVTPVGGTFGEMHALLISAAGPIVTMLIAVSAWLCTRHRWLMLTIVGAALAMRMVAAAASLSYPNDEARISLALGLGKWTVFGIVIAALLAIFISIWRRVRPGWRWWLASYLGASLGFTFNVFAEPFLPALSF